MFKMKKFIKRIVDIIVMISVGLGMLFWPLAAVYDVFGASAVEKILVKLKIPVNIDTTFIIANVIALTIFAAYILREKLLK